MVPKGPQPIARPLPSPRGDDVAAADLIVRASSESGQPIVREVKTFKVREQLHGNLHGYVNLGHDDFQVAERDAGPQVPDGREARGHGVDAAENTNTPARRAGRWPSADDPGGHKQRCLFYINGNPVGQYEEAGAQASVRRRS